MTPGIERSAIIYLAVNKENQKAYVGQTKNRFGVRVGNHYSVATTKDSRTPFHRALRKYGKDSFNFAVLEDCLASDADAREIYWISLFGCKTPNGYNRTDGGQGATGCEYTDERREKIRQSQLGDRNRMKNPETVKKHAEAIRGPRHPYYGKFGAEHPRFGKRHKLSEETKAKQRAYWNQPEVVQQRRDRMLARQAELNTPEIRAKRSEGLKRYWNSEEGRARQSQRMTEVWKKRKEA